MIELFKRIRKRCSVKPARPEVSGLKKGTKRAMGLANPELAATGARSFFVREIVSSNGIVFFAQRVKITVQTLTIRHYFISLTIFCTLNLYLEVFLSLEVDLFHSQP